MASLDEFAAWAKGRPDVEHGGQVAEETIAAAERRLGSFPAVYRDFLRRFGFLWIGSAAFYGLGADAPSWLNLVSATEEARAAASNPLPAHLLPVRDNGGGDLYCLDTRQAAATGESPVLYWDHARQLNPADDLVAPDFAAFLMTYVEALERRTERRG